MRAKIKHYRKGLDKKFFLLVIISLCFFSIFFLAKNNYLLFASNNLEKKLNTIKVVEINDKIKDDKTIAVPEKIINTQERKSRYFIATIQNNEITPKIFTCYKDEILNIAFKAIDKNYMLFQQELGLKTIVKKGNEVIINFLMSKPGNFAIYCPSCENNLEKMAYIMVVEK